METRGQNCVSPTLLFRNKNKKNKTSTKQNKKQKRENTQKTKQKINKKKQTKNILVSKHNIG
jgi:hypothetical protein